MAPSFLNDFFYEFVTLFVILDPVATVPIFLMVTACLDRKRSLLVAAYALGVAFVILLFVLVGQPEGIGFLIAAKSLLRFGEMTREHDRRVSEYVIIGTLASFGWGLGAAFGTQAILGALAP